MLLRRFEEGHGARTGVVHVVVGPGRVPGHHERAAPEQRRGVRHPVEPVVPGRIRGDQQRRKRPGQWRRAGRGRAVRPARTAPVRRLRARERWSAARARFVVVHPIVPVAVVGRRRRCDHRRFADRVPAANVVVTAAARRSAHHHDYSSVGRG